MPVRVNRAGWMAALCRWSLIAVVAMACAGVRIARAQTLFAWPDTIVDYARYRTPEECVAAVNRLRRGAAWGADRDTFPADPDAPLPDAIVASAKRCAANFGATGEGARSAGRTVEARDLPSLMSLHLMAGDDSAARAVADRMTASVASQPVPVRAAILVAVLHLYVKATPPRIEDVRRVIAELQRLGPAASAARRDAYRALGAYARETMNMPLLEVATDGWLDEIAYLSDSLKNNPNFRAMLALGAANSAAVLSLPQLAAGDTAAYWGHVAAAVKRIVGNVPEVNALLARFRRIAPTITGDVWFHRDSAAAPRPTRGTVGLIVFVDPECGSACAGGYAALRRTAERFGAALQVTLVAATHGYFRRRPPLSPSEEAAAMRDYFFDYLHLPGALAVTATRFTRRPDPDRRLVPERFENLRKYDGDGRLTAPLQAFLVDKAGVIAWSAFMQPDQERLIDAMLSALITSGTHATS